MGLRLKEQKGSRHAPPPLVSEGRGPPLGAQQASWARVGWANALLSSPAPPVWEGPSPMPLLISPASLLWPQGPTRPGGGFGGQGTSLGAQQAPHAQVGGAVALHSSPAPPGGPLPPASCSPLGCPPVPPRTHETWRGLWSAGDGPGSSAGSQGPRGQGNRPPLLSRSSWRVPPTCLS